VNVKRFPTERFPPSFKQGGKRLGDETSASEQEGVMQWTGIKLGARSKWLPPWVSSIILIIYLKVPEKRLLWVIFSAMIDTEKTA